MEEDLDREERKRLERMVALSKEEKDQETYKAELAQRQNSQMSKQLSKLLIELRLARTLQASTANQLEAREASLKAQEAAEIKVQEKLTQCKEQNKLLKERCQDLERKLEK